MSPLTRRHYADFLRREITFSEPVLVLSISFFAFIESRSRRDTSQPGRGVAPTFYADAADAASRQMLPKQPPRQAELIRRHCIAFAHSLPDAAVLHASFSS